MTSVDVTMRDDDKVVYWFLIIFSLVFGSIMYYVGWVM